MQTIAWTRNANYQFKMTTFLLLIVQFFYQNRVQAVEDIDQPCKFYENLTTDADFIA